MYLYNDILFSVAKASAVELIDISTPTIESVIFPSVTLIISIIGSLITLQSGIKDVLFNTNMYNNGSSHNYIVNSLASLKTLDYVFDEIFTHNNNCIEEFACEIGKITAENVPSMKYLATKIWNNTNTLESCSYLDGKEKIFIQSLMDPKKCEKRDYNCKLLQEIDKTIKKIKSLKLAKTTTTPTPIAPRSMFGFNLDIEKYMEAFNDMISK